MLEDKKLDCDKCKEEKCDDCSGSEQKLEKDDDKKTLSGRKVKKPRKNRKALNKPEGQCFFPMSMSMLFGPIGDMAADDTPPSFPYNVTFKQVIVLISTYSLYI